ncbi:hypothetical protein CF149_07334 [Pseudomonas psychrophila]|nr:hypothetical protein CF149_07334 [Pseudomonas psychrophila]
MVYACFSMQKQGNRKQETGNIKNTKNRLFREESAKNWGIKWGIRPF